jgi:iron(III) transport system substrate-binding protein
VPGSIHGKGEPLRTGHAVRFAAPILALTAVVAACGSDNNSGSAATTAASAATTAAATTAAATTTVAGATTSSVATSATTAASSAFADVVAAAEKEGKVTLYSVMVPDINTRLTDAFKQAYPKINLEIIRVPGNEIDAKLDAEKKTGSAGADIVANVNYPWVAKATTDGSLATVTGPDATSPAWKGTQYSLNDNVLMVTFTNIGLGWNKGAAPAGVKSFDDLLDPKYGGGKIGLPDPIAAVVADFYATLEDTYGPDYLTKLAAQKPVFFPGAVPLEQSMVSGDISVGGYTTNIGVSAAKASGAPVDFVTPKNAWAPPIEAYVPAWSKHPNAAQVLMNFMASEKGQEVLAKNSFSPLPNIPGTAGSLNDVKVADVKRITTPGWYDTYYANWKKTFGR